MTFRLLARWSQRGGVRQAHSMPLPPVPQTYSWERFRTDGKAVIDFIVDYHAALERSRPSKHRAGGEENAAFSHVPVTPQGVAPGFLRSERSLLAKLAPDAAPASDFAEVLREVERFVLPGMVHWQHPSFLAYFPAQVSPPALLGELLAGAMNQPGFTWDASPAATELEMVVTDAFVRAMQLPSRFLWQQPDRASAHVVPDGSGGSGSGGGGRGGGVIHPSATEALVTTMLAAKARATRRASVMSAFRQADDISSRLVCYFSDQSHFMQVKAAKILGIPHQRCVKTYFDAATQNYPICPHTLRARITEDVASGLVPFFINANFGATGTCAIDPIDDLAELARQCGAWLHVDAAYAGAVALCPEHRPLLGSLDGVDSIGINGSKWMSLMFNCSFLFMADASDLVQSLNATGTYLPESKSVDLKDYQLGLGRPFRSLKVYTTLRAMGFAGMADVVRRHMLLAQHLDERLRSVPEFKILVKTQFALVVFCLRMASDDANVALAQRLGKQANLYALPTRVGNRMGIRVSLAYAAMDRADVDSIFERILECARS